MAFERRVLSLAQIEAQQVNGQRIAPGIWLDAAGDVHYSVPELLALVDLADTAENRDRVIALIRDFADRHGAVLVQQDLRPE